MAEPQPSDIKAGSSSAAADVDGENPGLKPASKDDAKAAAALDKLDGRGEKDDEGGGSGSSADNAALAGAMSNLKVDGAGAGGGTAGSSKLSAAEEARRKKAAVKVNAKDVALVVEHCDLRKDKATELLRNYDGDLKRALTAWVTGEA